jgi:hypothetical protein
MNKRAHAPSVADEPLYEVTADEATGAGDEYLLPLQAHLALSAPRRGPFWGSTAMISISSSKFSAFATGRIRQCVITLSMQLRGSGTFPDLFALVNITPFMLTRAISNPAWTISRCNEARVKY